MLQELKYAVSELRDNYNSSHWWRSRINHRIIQPFQQQVYPRYDGAINVMDEEWDNLIILDGCRADLFEHVVDTSEFDEYRRVKSQGGATGEWTRRNFTGKAFGDTVYVSANPNPSKLAADSFHKLYEVWEEAFDDEAMTVLPEPVVETALSAVEEHPNKRLIAHFMQPHRPFVRDEDLQFQAWVPETGGILKSGPQRPYDPWDALEMCVVTRDEVWEGYANNLEFVCEQAREMATQLDGRTVITSDHGNLLGERSWPIPIRLYGHQSGLRVPELITVPWAVIEGKTTRKVVEEGVHSTSEATSDEIEGRLRDLGYID